MKHREAGTVQVHGILVPGTEGSLQTLRETLSGWFWHMGGDGMKAVADDRRLSTAAILSLMAHTRCTRKLDDCAPGMRRGGAKSTYQWTGVPLGKNLPMAEERGIYKLGTSLWACRLQGGSGKDCKSLDGGGSSITCPVNKPIRTKDHVSLSP